MFEQVLSPRTRKNLALVARTPLAGQFYLAGGTAVALHLGHRMSYDLDFFTPQSEFPGHGGRDFDDPAGNGI